MVLYMHVSFIQGHNSTGSSQSLEETNYEEKLLLCLFYSEIVEETSKRCIVSHSSRVDATFLLVKILLAKIDIVLWKKSSVEWRRMQCKVG